MVSTQIAIKDGAVAGQAEQWFWEALFDRSDLTRRSAASLNREPASKITLAWLAQKISGAGTRERRDRFEMIRFAQGVFEPCRGRPRH